MKDETFQIDYKDDGLSIMETVNEALSQYGISFETDDEPHDGFQPYKLMLPSDESIPYAPLSVADFAKILQAPRSLDRARGLYLLAVRIAHVAFHECGEYGADPHKEYESAIDRAKEEFVNLGMKP
jgi:hypothetical protein